MNKCPYCGCNLWIIAFWQQITTLLSEKRDQNMFRCELNVSFCTDTQCFCCYPNNTNYTLWSIFVATGFIKRKLLLPRITIIRKFKTPCFHINLKIEAWLNVYHLPIYLIGSCFCTLMMPKYEIRILMNEIIILRCRLSQ